MKRQSLGLLRPNVRQFIILYRQKKKQPYSSSVCLCEILEILLSTPAHFKDTSFSGSLTFDNLIDLRELKVGYDGDSLFEISLYYLESYIEDRIKRTIL